MQKRKGVGWWMVRGWNIIRVVR